MGRTSTFENKVALNKAMHLFWRKGYEHCSLAELLEAMEIGNSSFYNTFGNKKKVFMQTLELYYTDAADHTREIFTSERSIQEKIHAMFQYAIERQLDPDCPKGCFIVNTVSADAIEDPDILRQVRYYLDTFEYSLERALTQAIKGNQLDPNIDARSTAAVLNFYLQGLMKLSLLEYPIAKLRQQTDYFLTALGL
jgi:TetR/AcrR family transcriptional repressor of nem operon